LEAILSKTIVFASAKGGVGKTTSCLLLAMMLARAGLKVIVIDADARLRVLKWAIDEKTGERRSTIPSLIEVIAANQGDLMDKIEEASVAADYVLVDLEGAGSVTMLQAIAMADFVIIPTQPSDMDAEEAIAAIKLVKGQEKSMRKQGNVEYRLPYGVLFTKTPAAVKTRTFRHIEKSMVDAGVPLFATELTEREAFRAFYSFRTTLDALTSAEAPNVEKAVENAHAFMTEVIEAAHGRKSLLPAVEEGAKA
jgi:chromosome partitioning protein